MTSELPLSVLFANAARITMKFSGKYGDVELGTPKAVTATGTEIHDISDEVETVIIDTVYKYLDELVPRWELGVEGLVTLDLQTDQIVVAGRRGEVAYKDFDAIAPLDRRRFDEQ